MPATGISSLPLSYSDAVLFDVLSIMESYFNFTFHPPDLFWPRKHNTEMKSAKGIKGVKKKRKKKKMENKLWEHLYSLQCTEEHNLHI